MLKALLNRSARPEPGHLHDPLFADIAPGSANASARLLAVLYEQYTDASAPAPQYLHYRRMVRAVAGGDDPRVLRGLTGKALQRVRAAYVCCFEPHDLYMRQVAAWWADPVFLALLFRTREALIADLEAHAAAAAAERDYLARLAECRATPIDLEGASLLDQIKQMGPDDWHEIVLSWNWDHGIAELEWITSRRECDRATAVYAYCRGAPGRIARRCEKPSYERGRWDYGGYVRAVAARLEGGFYMNAQFALALPAETSDRFEREIALARATGESPWQTPDGLVSHPGRAHAPRYALNHGVAHYHYDHWLAHIAKR